MTTTLRKPKLTTVERRALAFCESLDDNDGGTITVEWKKSAMWGSNPVIESHDGECCSVSTALADVLKYLFPIGSPGYDAIALCGGCGVSSVANHLAMHNWRLVQTANGKTFDVFQLSRA